MDLNNQMLWQTESFLIVEFNIVSKVAPHTTFWSFCQFRLHRIKKKKCFNTVHEMSKSLSPNGNIKSRWLHTDLFTLIYIIWILLIVNPEGHWLISQKPFASTTYTKIANGNAEPYTWSWLQIADKFASPTGLLRANAWIGGMTFALIPETCWN